ncbi:MAG: NTP transferase domain-containing protein [Actinomycetia bacterium]|nr:NTP transferase domain-containing protein [Actinomycetes bacterium]MCP4226937.1 NTP transferase domain-containing protein [Actinomycetes bacterium]MCP5030866.1 NTP transferase domain-containing protein [Actinomycetes bacterium]
MNPWGVVVAGGTGSRFGQLKQLAPLGDRRVLDWSVQLLQEACEGVVVVLPQPFVGQIEVEGADAVVAGGADRSASVRAGLSAVGAGATHVLVHDAARPLASAALVERVRGALEAGAEGAVPVVAVSDSLQTVDGVPVDRSRYVAVQTPQGFEIGLLRQAHASNPSASDDATLLARLGLSVCHVEGELTNLKITEPHDLHIAEVLLDER